MITPQALGHLQTHRQELQCHAVVLSHVWTQVPARTSLLVAHPRQVEDACTHLIEMLLLMQTIAEGAAAYVEPRPLLVSLPCRLAPAQLFDAVEETIRSLVLLRDTCRTMPWAKVREQQQALHQLRDLHTLVQHTITTLQTEARHPETERNHSCQ